MKVKEISLLAALILVTIGCVQHQSDMGCCVAVLDGDTFELESGETVRLIGIDAPEYSEPGGDIARDILSCMILNKEVTLVAGYEERDSYGRLLRYVYVSNVCINEEMIRNGYSEVRYLPENDPNLDYYLQLEIEAESKGAGLWGCKIFQPRSNLNWEGNIPVINWFDADKYYGQYVIVEGVIVDTYNSGAVCFLNFHADWQQNFTAVIFACDFAHFSEPPEIYYLGKKVQIIGFVKEYRGKPEIIVKTPGQIRIIG